MIRLHRCVSPFKITRHHIWMIPNDVSLNQTAIRVSSLFTSHSKSKRLFSSTSVSSLSHETVDTKSQTSTTESCVENVNTQFEKTTNDSSPLKTQQNVSSLQGGSNSHNESHSGDHSTENEKSWFEQIASLIFLPVIGFLIIRPFYEYSKAKRVENEIVSAVKYIAFRHPLLNQLFETYPVLLPHVSKFNIGHNKARVELVYYVDDQTRICFRSALLYMVSSNSADDQDQLHNVENSVQEKSYRWEPLLAEADVITVNPDLSRRIEQEIRDQGSLVTLERPDLFVHANSTTTTQPDHHEDSEVIAKRSSRDKLLRYIVTHLALPNMEVTHDSTESSQTSNNYSFDLHRGCWLDTSYTIGAESTVVRDAASTRARIVVLDKP